MKTYMSVSRPAKTKWVQDGNTGNAKANAIVKIMYERFPVFEINVTLKEGSQIGFYMAVKSHNNEFRQLFGVISIEHSWYIHDTPEGRDHYRISGTKDSSYRSPIVSGHISTGPVFADVLEDFLAGTSALIEGKIATLRELQEYDQNLMNGVSKDSENFYVPDMI